MSTTSPESLMPLGADAIWLDEWVTTEQMEAEATKVWGRPGWRVGDVLEHPTSPSTLKVLSMFAQWGWDSYIWGVRFLVMNPYGYKPYISVGDWSQELGCGWTVINRTVYRAPEVGRWDYSKGWVPNDV